MVVVRTVAVTLAIVVWSATVASGQKRTDVVTLLNGDRITGEIVDLERGRLELKTDDAGTIDIEWDKVASVVAARQFELETSDGRRLLGSLGRTADRVVLIVSGDSPLPMPMPEITRITPIGASFWAKLDGSVDAGFTYTQSSGVAQITLNTATAFRRPAFLFQLSSSVTVTEQNDGTERDDRADIEFSYVRYRGRRLFISGNASLESNESVGLRLRTQLGTLVGVRVVSTNRAQFEIGAGVVVNDERGVETAATQNVEAVLGVGTSYYTYDRPKTQFDADIHYYPNLSTWGRQRLQVDGAVKRELWKDFFVSFNGFYDFDSDPPNPDAARTDTGVVFSLGWSY